MTGKAEEFAAAVLITTSQGIPLVREPNRSPSFWKLPGGKGKDSETPEECAVREVKEETGLVILADNLFMVDCEDRGSHKFIVLQTSLSDLSGILAKGEEGEEVRIFSVREIMEMKDFLPQHCRIVEKIMKALVN